MIDNALARLCEKMLALGKKLGADEMEIAVSDRREFSVEVLQGDIEKLVDAGGRALSFELIIDKKTASASTSDFSPGVAETMVRSAVERARLASADPFAGLPEQFASVDDRPDLALYDPKVAQMSAAEKIEAAKKIEALCLSDTRITHSHGSSFYTVTGEALLMNSKGFSGQYPVSTVGAGAYLQAGEGAGLIDEGWYDHARFLEDLWSEERIAQKAVHRATRLLGARKVETQRVPVVFEPSVTSALLGYLARCVSGNAIYLKNSFLAGRLGDVVASPLLKIIDDARIPRAPGSRPYDGEGTATRRLPVIQDGRLMNYLLDTYSARKLDLSSTGHASGSSNFYLDKGDTDPQAMIAGLDRGLLLTGFLGQGFNPITGDLSRGAFGLWIENGEVVHPVAEVTVSGNLGEMLMQIEQVGTDLEFRRSLAGPSLKIAEMTLSGT